MKNCWRKAGRGNVTAKIKRLLFAYGFPFRNPANGSLCRKSGNSSEPALMGSKKARQTATKSCRLPGSQAL
jgi:hypothetical protein